MTVKHGSSILFMLPFADTDHSGFGIQCFHSMAVAESIPPQQKDEQGYNPDGSVELNHIGYTCTSRMCKEPHTETGTTWNMRCKIQDDKEYTCIPFELDQSLRMYALSNDSEPSFQILNLVFRF